MPKFYPSFFFSQDAFLPMLVRLLKREILQENHSPLFYLRGNLPRTNLLSAVSSQELWTFIV